MKKLVLLMCIVFMKTVAFGQNTPGYSLNGYKYQEIVTMRDAYYVNNASLPKPTSIWFSKDVIKKILDLLDKEKAPNLQYADGIRIYFGYANNQITIILVSTYAFGFDGSVDSKTFHQDYFEHDPGIDLFNTAKTPGNHGITTDQTGSGPGASLYTPCGSPCPDDMNAGCNNQNTHYITRSFGERMVTNLKSTSTTITTKSEWFDLDMFRAVNRQNTYDGIRIYLGKHGADATTEPHSEVYNREAFIVVTTNGTTPQPDKQTDNFDCASAKMLLNYFKEFKDKKKRVHKGRTSPSPISLRPFFNGQDNGEICPTHCPGTTLQ